MRTTPRAFALNAPRLVTPAIGPGPGVRAQRRGALAVWATGEPILVYRRAANEPSPAPAAAQRQSKVRVPADGPLRDTRKGHWPTFGPHRHTTGSVAHSCGPAPTHWFADRQSP